MYIAKYYRNIALLLFLLAIISGAVDVIHMLDFKAKTHRMLSSQELQIGENVRALVPATETVMTPETVTNPIVMASGRSVLMGYDGWVFSYGFDYGERKDDIARFYETSDVAILEKYNVQYLYVPSDKQVINASFRQLYQNEAGTIYYYSHP